MVVNSPGQFYHGIEFEVGDQRPGEVPEKPDATMYVKGHQLNVTRYTCYLTSVSLNSEHLYRKFGEIYLIKLWKHLLTSVSWSLEVGSGTSARI